MKKRFFALVLTAVLTLGVLTGCGRRPSVDTADGTDTSGGSDTAIGMPDTGNGTQSGSESNTPSGGESNSDTNTEMSGDTTPVESVTTAAEAVRFINNNLYSLCSDILPMAVETRVLDMADSETVQYNTGLSETKGITDIILSESMVGSLPYSLVYVRTDGSNTDQVEKSLTDSIDPAKWVCVEAEAMNTVRLDNDILLVMGSTEQVETITTSLSKAAEGVFQSVGEVNSVL